jgi:hypothetical protein
MSHAVKFMTPVLGVHNVYGLVNRRFGDGPVGRM